MVSLQGLARTRVPSETECAKIQDEIIDAMESIKVVSSQKPILREPPILVSSGGHSSFDPCSLVRSRTVCWNQCGIYNTTTVEPSALTTQNFQTGNMSRDRWCARGRTEGARTSGSNSPE